uniref:Protein kinase domain-containing protein n=1 Tax=Alexandrium monilatum TaxID=311494 RepID=A0A7S4R6C9_9DINO
MLPPGPHAPQVGDSGPWDRLAPKVPMPMHVSPPRSRAQVPPPPQISAASPHKMMPLGLSPSRGRPQQASVLAQTQPLPPPPAFPKPLRPPPHGLSPHGSAVSPHGGTAASPHASSASPASVSSHGASLRPPQVASSSQSSPEACDGAEGPAFGGRLGTLHLQVQSPSATQAHLSPQWPSQMPTGPSLQPLGTLPQTPQTLPLAPSRSFHSSPAQPAPALQVPEAVDLQGGLGGPALRGASLEIQAPHPPALSVATPAVRSPGAARPQALQASPARQVPGPEAAELPPSGQGFRAASQPVHAAPQARTPERQPAPPPAQVQLPPPTAAHVEAQLPPSTAVPVEVEPADQLHQAPAGPPLQQQQQTEGTHAKARVPPLQTISLTKPPPELPPQLATEFEADCDLLGEGAFAVVRRLRHRRSGEHVALKVVEKHPLHIRNMLPQLQREVRIQGRLQHRHILRLLSCLEDEAYVYMVLENCPGGSLRGLCAAQPSCRLPEARAARYFAQICQGVDFMHQHLCVHRDLKPENMLLAGEDEVRICDFGWSAEVQAEAALRTTCGTPHYWAPEIFEGSPQDAAVDLWALGTLVYELLVGHAPFWGSMEELRRKVVAVDLRYPPGLLSHEAIKLFYCLLQRDPRNRVPAGRLLAEHPWVRGALSGAAAPGFPAAAPPAVPGMAMPMVAVAPPQEATADGGGANAATPSTPLAPPPMVHPPPLGTGGSVMALPPGSVALAPPPGSVATPLTGGVLTPAAAPSTPAAPPPAEVSPAPHRSWRPEAAERRAASPALVQSRSWKPEAPSAVAPCRSWKPEAQGPSGQQRSWRPEASVAAVSVPVVPTGNVVAPAVRPSASGARRTLNAALPAQASAAGPAAAPAPQPAQQALSAVPPPAPPTAGGSAGERPRAVATAVLVAPPPSAAEPAASQGAPPAAAAAPAGPSVVAAGPPAERTPKVVARVVGSGAAESPLASPEAPTRVMARVVGSGAAESPLASPEAATRALAALPPGLEEVPPWSLAGSAMTPAAGGAGAVLQLPSSGLRTCSRETVPAAALRPYSLEPLPTASAAMSAAALRPYSLEPLPRTSAVVPAPSPSTPITTVAASVLTHTASAPRPRSREPPAARIPAHFMVAAPAASSEPSSARSVNMTPGT